MKKAFLNTIETAVPPFDIHKKFTTFAPHFLEEDRQKKLFKRMTERSQIEHRFSFLEPDENPNKLDKNSFYSLECSTKTASRMQFYKKHAFELVKRAIDNLSQKKKITDTTHIIITSCTGFYAPGIDIDIIKRYQLKPNIGRSFIGFMGCYAAINALRLANHIVKSEDNAQVLIVNIELCTLHLKKTDNMEELLSFLIFADGCAASFVSSEPHGLELKSFNSILIPDTEKQITWDIGDLGFDMVLSGKVPKTIGVQLPNFIDKILEDCSQSQIEHWAVHPGGRSILDTVETSLGLNSEDLNVSRDVLRNYGNMSSATIMFVLQKILTNDVQGDQGCAMAFGPGVVVESLRFEKSN